MDFVATTTTAASVVCSACGTLHEVAEGASIKRAKAICSRPGATAPWQLASKGQILGANWYLTGKRVSQNNQIGTVFTEYFLIDFHNQPAFLIAGLPGANWYLARLCSAEIHHLRGGDLQRRGSTNFIYRQLDTVSLTSKAAEGAFPDQASMPKSRWQCHLYKAIEGSLLYMHSAMPNEYWALTPVSAENLKDWDKSAARDAEIMKAIRERESKLLGYIIVWSSLLAEFIIHSAFARGHINLWDLLEDASLLPDLLELGLIGTLSLCKWNYADNLELCLSIACIVFHTQVLIGASPIIHGIVILTILLLWVPKLLGLRTPSKRTTGNELTQPGTYPVGHASYLLFGYICILFCLILTVSIAAKTQG